MLPVPVPVPVMVPVPVPVRGLGPVLGQEPVLLEASVPGLGSASGTGTTVPLVVV